MASILVVDDDEQIRRVLGRVLKREGYACAFAGNAAEARQLLEREEFDLVLSDIMLPDESGIELAHFISSNNPNTGILMISAVDNPAMAARAIEAGVYGYLVKPFNLNELIINVRNALRRRELEIAHRRYREELEQKVEDRTVRLRKAMEGTVLAMSRAVEHRDPYTAGHQDRVAWLARSIAEQMGLSAHQMQGIYLGGLIHDVGKIYVPAEILSKPSRLSDIEFSLIKTHCKVGYDILQGIEFPWPLAELVLQHHERMDGSGYPQGLSGSEILPEARILAVCDVVEAMASHRPYRPSLGIDKALEEISKNSGKLYDPEVVSVCLQHFKEKGFKFSS